MTLSVYQSSVGAYKVSLNAFLSILGKAAEHAEKAKFDPAIYATLRLTPNMLPFNHQIHRLSDHAKNSSARLAGIDAPRFEDTEVSLDELKSRIEKTLAFLDTVDAQAVEAGADREIVLPLGPNKAKMLGRDYLLHFALPNYYFHLTTAYDLLRQAGVEIGKRDFMGQVPGFALV